MKFIFKTVGTVIAAVVLLVGFLYFYTGGMTRVADDFFESLTAEQHGQATALLSDFTIENSGVLYSYLENNDMDYVQDTSWHARNFVNNKGSIAGEVINGKGMSIPTRVDFFKEDGDWKIYAIAKHNSNAQNPKATLVPNEPSVQQQETLVSQSMAYFMQAAEQKSMASFRQHISKFWQAQISVTELDQAFGSIYNYTGDLNFLNGIKPTIETASINEDNLLVIKGFFTLKTSRIMIEQKYIYETTDWKLLSFSYNNEKNQRPDIQSG